jgi:uncharacterized OB-fold protein
MTEPSISTRAGQERLKERGVIPLPEPDEISSPYWEAAQRQELHIQHCAGCGVMRHPPSAECPHCDETANEWKPVSGKGTVYSFIIDHRLMVPGFDEPYVVAQINPDEAEHDTVRIVANVKGCDVSDVYIGMPVEVFFEERAGMMLPQFRPQSH